MTEEAERRPLNVPKAKPRNGAKRIAIIAAAVVALLAVFKLFPVGDYLTRLL